MPKYKVTLERSESLTMEVKANHPMGAMDVAYDKLEGFSGMEGWRVSFVEELKDEEDSVY